MQTDSKRKEEVEIYFTITKFDNDYGFSLIHQDNLEETSREEQNENSPIAPNPDLDNGGNGGEEGSPSQMSPTQAREEYLKQ